MAYYRNNTEIEIHLEQRRAFVRSFVRPTNEIQFFFFETSFWVKKEERDKEKEKKKKRIFADTMHDCFSYSVP